MKVVIQLIVCVLTIQIGFSQVTPAYKVSFNNCTAEDDIGTLDDNFVSPSVMCDCGVEADAAYFDEESDTIFADNGIKEILKEDFTFSMYFWADDAPEPYSLFSVQRYCSKDSAFIVRYIPSLKQVDVQMAKNFGVGVFLLGDLDPDRCWHHLLFTREDNVYSLSVDGEFIISDNINESVVLGEKHRVRIGSSPCLNDNETYTRGRIDEIQIFDQVLGIEDIQSLDLQPDRILTSDTTIFAGSSVLIETGSICSNIFSWTPTANLDNPNLIEPTATLDESQSYTLTIDHGSCIAQDEVNILVIDENSIDCNNLLLPNVFTPNDDKINDIFEISNDFIISELDYFDIYDRWGAKVFTTQNKQEGWDGFWNGVRQAPAMYVYKVEYTCQGDSYQKLGNFSLLK